MLINVNGKAQCVHKVSFVANPQEENSTLTLLFLLALEKLLGGTENKPNYNWGEKNFY